MKRQPEKGMRFQSTSFDLFFPSSFFFPTLNKKKSFSYRAAASFNFLRLKEEESGIENKKKVTVGVWLWPHKVSVGSGRYNAKKRARRACGRDKKKTRKLDGRPWLCRALLSLSAFLLVCFLLAPNHCPFPFFLFPNRPDVFQRPLGQSRFFWMGHKSATGIGDRVKVVGDGEIRRDSNIQLLHTMYAHVLRDTWTDFKRNDFLLLL